jgi:hypothetical protein
MIVLLLITLLVVGGAGLVGKTLFTGIVRDTKVLDAKSKANKQLDKNLEAAPKLVENYNALSDRRDLIANALPNTSDFPGLIALLENMSGQIGVTLKSVSPSLSATAAAPAPAGAAGATTTTGTAATASTATGTIEPPAAQPYSVSVAFDGNYTSLQQLLKSIELSARPMRVTSVQMSGSGSSLSAEVEITTYYQDKATLPFKTETVK